MGSKPKPLTLWFVSHAVDLWSAAMLTLILVLPGKCG